MKSKYRFGVMFALLFSLPLWALRPGDEVEKNEAKLKWINSTPMELGKVSKDHKERTPQLRALVFFFCRGANSDGMITMLEQCRMVNAGKLQIAAISPDQAAEVELFSKRHNEVRVKIAADLERKVTPRFTEGNMLLPMAFLIDREGKILWSGEAVDLPEAVVNTLAGKNDVELNRKLSPMIDEMQQWMRDGSEIRMANTAAKIFELAPGQPTTLRMRLFSLENSGRLTDAMQLIDTQIKKAPQLTRLYFTALDLMLRYPQLRGELPSIAERFALNPATTGARCTFVDALLLNFPGDFRAIEGAQLILEYTPLPRAPGEKALLAQSRARFAYASTDLDGALKAQQEALAALPASSGSATRQAVQNQLEFFRKLKQLRSRAASEK